jgi:hypothetical protein
MRRQRDGGALPLDNAGADFGDFHGRDFLTANEREWTRIAGASHTLLQKETKATKNPAKARIFPFPVTLYFSSRRQMPRSGKREKEEEKYLAARNPFFVSFCKKFQVLRA